MSGGMYGKDAVSYRLCKLNSPTIAFLEQYIAPEDSFIDMVPSEFEIRNEYVKHSFPILSHEFILSVSEMVKGLKITQITELSCGIGWLTYWLRKYNIPIKECVDNMTWKKYHKYYLKHVKKYDSVKYVKSNGTIELFILSWPYMDKVAENIWKAMSKGQYLLFIGEDEGGCTATDDFFQLINEYEVNDIWKLNKNFKSFWGIHDTPTLFRKEE